MADTKISALPASTTPLAGTEVLPIVQGSTTKQVSVANLTAGRAVATGKLTSTVTSGTTYHEFVADGLLNWGANGYLVGSFNSKTVSGYPGIYIGYNSSTFGGIIGPSAVGAAPSQGLEIWAYDNVSAFKQVGTFSAVTAKAGLTLDIGNLTVSTAAKGVNFIANTPAAGMTSQLLNWYEEGTWTTTVTSASNFTGTPTLDLALYTKVGRLVQIEGRFSGTVTTGSTLTYFVFTIPFNTSANTSGATGTIVSNSGLKIGAVLDSSAAGAGQMLFMIPAQAAQPSGADTFFFSVTYAAA